MKSKVQKWLDSLIALIIIGVATFILFHFSISAGLFFLAVSIVYAIFVIVRTPGGRLHMFLYRYKAISSMLPNVLKAVDTPVLVVGPADKIIWANKSFENLKELSTYVTLPLSSKIFHGIFGYERMQSAYQEGNLTFELETAESLFHVQILELHTKSKKYYAAFLVDATREFALHQRLKDNNIRLAYIAIDNASELSQNSNETFRMTTAKIQLALTEWAKEMDAILMEYEDGKFFMLFDQLHLKAMQEDKFSIIDTVSELSSGNYTLPLTISIGISEEGGSLAEKQTSAINALRIAFQRGGATAVIKTADGHQSFGGKRKSVQKQTGIRSRICRDLLLDNIRTSSNVLIMGHRRPDYDSIASNVGIASLVRYLGKPVNIITDVDEVNISNAFQLLKPLEDYETMFVDARRGMDLMTPYTLLIITDASSPNNFYSEDFYRTAQRVIVIDHHTLDKHLDDNVLLPTNIDPNASSASELVCEILELSIPDGFLRAEEAQLMMIGILLDTQFFSRDTGSRTFRACSYLRMAGADPAKAKLLFKTELSEFDRIDRFEQAKYLFCEKFMISYFDGEPDQNNMVAAAKSAERLVGISGVVASFVLYTLDSGISLSARSDGTFNVVNIVSRLGGGGHFQSAGARLMRDGQPVDDMDEARAMLEAAIQDYLNSL